MRPVLCSDQGKDPWTGHETNKLADTVLKFELALNGYVHFPNKFALALVCICHCIVKLGGSDTGNMWMVT